MSASRRSTSLWGRMPRRSKHATARRPSVGERPMPTERRQARSSPSIVRIALLVVFLAIVGIVYLALPASWFQVETPKPQSVGARPAPRLDELAKALQTAPADPVARSRYGFALAQANR